MLGGSVKNEAYERGLLNKDSKDEDLSAAMDLVYLMLGRAISDWGKVEKSLCSVFTNCFPFMHGAPAGHAFFEPRSFQTQLNMTSRAVVIACQASLKCEELTQEWWKLFERAGKASSNRNRLAHGSVLCDRKFEDENFFVRFEAFASARTYNSSATRNLEKASAKKHWETTPKTFTALELNELSADFFSLSDSLNDFSRELGRTHRAGIDSN